MNLSETAFITQAKDCSSSNDRYFLQWFTPTNEVNLCGHATLATAHILFERILNKDCSINELIFETKYAGELKVKKYDKNQLEVDFPMGDPQSIEFDDKILDELKLNLNLSSRKDILNIQLCKRTKYLLIHLSKLDHNIKPQENLMKINYGERNNSWIHGIIVTSVGTTSRIDFISRFFVHGMEF